jgi:hypothetical protein
VRKNRSIFPRPCGRPGVECVRPIPSPAQTLASCREAYGAPLSTFCSRAGYVAARLTLGVVTVDGGIVVFLSGT